MSFLEFAAATILACLAVGLLLCVMFGITVYRFTLRAASLTSKDIDIQAGHLCTLLKGHDTTTQHRVLVKAWETLVEPVLKQENAQITAYVKKAHFGMPDSGTVQ